MWAAGAKPRGAFGSGTQGQGLQCFFFGIQHGQVGVDAGRRVGIHAQLFEAFGNGPCNQGRGEVGIGPQQGAFGGIGR